MSSKPDVAPVQSLCFLDLTMEQTKEVNTQCSEVELWVVVRSFKEPPKPVRPSNVVSHGTLHNEFVAHPCNGIVGPVAVVCDGTLPTSNNNFVVVANCNHWLWCFDDLLQNHTAEDISEIHCHSDSDNNSIGEPAFVETVANNKH